LTNAEIDENDYEKFENDYVEKDGKRYIKGNRLKHYADFTRIYRNSRNMKKPLIVDDMDLSDYKKIYTSAIEIEADERKNYIISEQYKRLAGQQKK